MRPGKREIPTASIALSSNGLNGDSEAVGTARSTMLACVTLGIYPEIAALMHRASHYFRHTHRAVAPTSKMVRRSTAVIKQRADARAVHIDTRHDFSFRRPSRTSSRTTLTKTNDETAKNHPRRNARLWRSWPVDLLLRLSLLALDCDRRRSMAG